MPVTVVSDQTEFGIRTIVKSDGVVVRITGGIAKVEYPSGHAKAARAASIAAKAAAKLLKDPSLALPLELRPVNAASKSKEEIGRMMSNFAHTPFNLDGRHYESVEGFYQGLYHEDPLERQRIGQLTGSEAKRTGKTIDATTLYDGAIIELGSSDHHALIKRAIKAKFAQNRPMAEALIATYPRPIVHNLADGPNTKLKAEDFARLLTEIRQELMDENFDDQK